MWTWLPYACYDLRPPSDCMLDCSLDMSFLTFSGKVSSLFIKPSTFLFCASLEEAFSALLLLLNIIFPFLLGFTYSVFCEPMSSRIRKLCDQSAGVYYLRKEHNYFSIRTIYGNVCLFSQKYDKNRRI